MPGGDRTMSRRAALSAIGAGGAVVGGGIWWFADDSSPSNSTIGDTDPTTPRNVATGSVDTSVTLDPQLGAARAGPDTTSRMYLYNDQYPAPVIRITEGDTFRASVYNTLPEPTTIHWHGIPVPNRMDGVPRVTQSPVQPEATFEYRFKAAPPGTFVYHSHVGLQLDWNLLGVFIIEEDDPHVEYDREYVVLLNEYLDHQPPDGEFPSVPEYSGLVVNGKLPSTAPKFEVSEDDRIRFRLINGAGATTFRVRLAGHSMTVAYKDGRPVEPVAVDAIDIGALERYDVIVTADDPGVWELQAAAVNGDDIGNPAPAIGIVRYENADVSEPSTPDNDGRTLAYDDLVAKESYPTIDGDPDRTYRLRLSRGPEPGSWAISDQLYPGADWLDVKPGEHVRFILQNRSDMIHPMHLHGHFYEREGAFMDTSMVRPDETVAFDFYADNPCRWLFHCHNDYHRESGMARVVRYR